MGTDCSADGAAARRRLDVGSATVQFATVDPRSPDAQWAMGEYFGELATRFVGGFEPGDAFDVDAVAFQPPDGAFVLVRNDLEPIGCGAVQRVADDVAEVKRMWIHPQWRGLGLGPRLLAHLEAIARSMGRSRVVLDTNGTLVEAIALYAREGYHPIDRYNDNPYAHHWFAKDLVP